MKVILNLSIFALCILTLSTKSYADGNLFLDQCSEAERLYSGESTVTNYNVGYCIGVIHTMQHLFLVMKLSDDPLFNTCIPTEVSTGQLIRVLLLYLRNNPATLHEDELNLAVLAFMGSYPCR